MKPIFSSSNNLWTTLISTDNKQRRRSRNLKRTWKQDVRNLDVLTHWLIELELENGVREKAQLIETIEHQEINAVDVERMHAEKASLEQQLSAVAAYKEGKEKQIFDLEIQGSKKYEDVEKIIQQFSTTARKMKMMPASAKFAKGVNYQLTMNSSNPELILDHIRGTVKVKKWH